MFPARVGKMGLDGVLGLELPMGENLTEVTSINVDWNYRFVLHLQFRG
jgi:hypothetical protein